MKTIHFSVEPKPCSEGRNSQDSSGEHDRKQSVDRETPEHGTPVASQQSDPGEQEPLIDARW